MKIILIIIFFSNFLFAQSSQEEITMEDFLNAQNYNPNANFDDHKFELFLVENRHMLSQDIIDEIESIESVIYRPIGDFGGWGIRFGFKAKAYTTKGNKGVMINLKTGRKVLFGSQKSKELEKAFNYYLKN